MKLIFCTQCDDVRKLSSVQVTCKCGESWGHYREDGVVAEIGGKAVPIGFYNPSLSKALRQRPQSGQGARFEAFVIPRECPSIHQSTVVLHRKPAKSSRARLAAMPPPEPESDDD